MTTPKPRPGRQAGITDKMERFIAEYLIDGNGTRAALAAGYSPKTADKQASNMLKRPDVRSAVNAGKKRVAAKLDLSAEKVLADIERIANAAEKDKEYNAALKGKELLGKHLKLFTEKHEHGGIGGGPVVLQVSGTDENL